MGLNLVYSGNDGGAAFGSCDISFDTGSEIESAVLSSLLSWGRARQDEVSAGETRYGWWADNNIQYPIGSKIWLLQRAKVLPNLNKRAKQYVQDALQWLIDEGVALQVDVVTSINQYNTLSIGITITKNDGSVINMSYDNLWNKLFS